MWLSTLLIFSFIFPMVHLLDGIFTPADASTKGGCDIVIMLPPELKDSSGNFLSTAHVGQQVFITTIFANCTNEEIPYTVVLEARSEDNVTVYLQFQAGLLDANADSGIGLAWSPEEAGKYQLRTFALSDLNLPQIYSQVWISEVTIS